MRFSGARPLFAASLAIFACGQPANHTDLFSDRSRDPGASGMASGGAPSGASGAPAASSGSPGASGASASPGLAGATATAGMPSGTSGTGGAPGSAGASGAAATAGGAGSGTLDPTAGGAGSATAGGGTGGASTGGAPSNPACDELHAETQRRLRAAQACNSNMPRFACNDFVADECDCQTPVNDSDSEATASYLQAVAELKQSCTIACLICIDATDASCRPNFQGNGPQNTGQCMATP